MSEGEEKKPEKKEKEKITLKVRDANEEEVVFQIKKSTKMKKLTDAYCKSKSILKNSVVFMFEDERIDDDSTPTQIGLENDDIIDVLVHQTGG